MAWWKRLFGSSDADKAREKPAAEAPAGPVEEAPAGPVKEPTAEEELRPGLRARVYSCDLDSAQGLVPCWVYLSEGLAAFHEQKEIVFCLRRQSTEAAATDYPREILKFFGLLADMATEGDTVDLGETTEFSEAGLFEGSAHRALAYLPVIPLPGIPLPQRALLAILITQEELEVAKAFGLYRLSTRLGRRASHFPYPPWSGRHRASVVTPLMMLSSVLHPVPRLLLRGALHGHQGTTIRLSIARRLHNALRAQLEDRPADEALALLGDPRPEASARLVWEEGQEEPAAISPPTPGGSGLAGGFVLCLPGRTPEGGRIVEDGYAIDLGDASWRALRNALLEGKDWALAARGQGLNFVLEWLEPEDA